MSLQNQLNSYNNELEQKISVFDFEEKIVMCMCFNLKTAKEKQFKLGAAYDVVI